MYRAILGLQFVLFHFDATCWDSRISPNDLVAMITAGARRGEVRGYPSFICIILSYDGQCVLFVTEYCCAVMASPTSSGLWLDTEHVQTKKPLSVFLLAKAKLSTETCSARKPEVQSVTCSRNTAHVFYENTFSRNTTGMACSQL